MPRSRPSRAAARKRAAVITPDPVSPPACAETPPPTPTELQTALDALAPRIARHLQFVREVSRLDASPEPELDFVATLPTAANLARSVLYLCGDWTESRGGSRGANAGNRQRISLARCARRAGGRACEVKSELRHDLQVNSPRSPSRLCRVVGPELLRHMSAARTGGGAVC